MIKLLPLFSLVLLLACSHVAAGSLRVFSHCVEQNWKLLFRPIDCPYRVTAEGEHQMIDCKKSPLAILEVEQTGSGFKVVEVISGNAPASGRLEMKSLHRMMKIYSNEDTLRRYAQAPRLDDAVHWEHLPGEGLNDWLGIVHQASLDEKQLEHIRQPDNPTGSRYIFVVYHQEDGTWGFRLQGICDLLLVERDTVYAPIYLKGRTPNQVWLRHPLGDKPAEFKKFLAETARQAAAEATE
jgi:hypothetical protein